MLAIKKKGHKYEWFGRQHTVWYVCKSQKDKTLRYCEAWADINVFLEYSLCWSDRNHDHDAVTKASTCLA